MPNLKPGKAALRDASQSATVAAVGALTSAAAAGSTPTKAEFDKVVVDLASLRTTLNALLAAEKTAGIVASS